MGHNEDDDTFNALAYEAEAAARLPKAGMVRVKKGEEINITRLDPGLREITVGVGWDLRAFEGDPVDVDASVFLLDRNDRTREDEDFVFYNNLTGREGAVRHMGDSRTGAGDGDDEKIIIDLMSLPFEVVKIAFVLSIYDLDLNSNNFNLVKNVYFRIVNNETNHETFRFELDEDMGSGTGLYIGYLERVGSDWMYRALGDPVYGGLAKIASDFGIVVVQNIRA
jgi:tellurium resistance protein TerD